MSIPGIVPRSIPYFMPSAVPYNVPYTPPYIVIEGIDGSGKTTQADLLTDHYRAQGRRVEALHEPTDWYAEQKEHATRWDNRTKLFYLLLDRHQNVLPVLERAKQSDTIVVADRNYLSTIVYQTDLDDPYLSTTHIADLHRFVPTPSHLILLDIDPSQAIQRVRARADSRSEPLSEYETIEQLQRFAERYRQALTFFPRALRLPIADQSADDLHQVIVKLLQLT